MAAVAGREERSGARPIGQRHPLAAAVQPTARVGFGQPLVGDIDAVARFADFDRTVERIAMARRIHGVEAIALGGCAPSAHLRFDHRIAAAGIGMFARNHRAANRCEGAGRQSVRHGPRHALPEHVVESYARLEIIAVRGRALRMENRSGFGDDFERTKRSLVGEQRRISQRLENHLGGDNGAVAAGVVWRGALFRVAREVDEKAVGRDGDRSAPERAIILFFRDPERSAPASRAGQCGRAARLPRTGRQARRHRRRCRSFRQAHGCALRPSGTPRPAPRGRR